MCASAASYSPSALAASGRWRLLRLALRSPSAPQTYTVKRGDTLYAIAWRHKLDWQDLARWNGIRRDYVIHPGPGAEVVSIARVACVGAHCSELLCKADRAGARAHRRRRCNGNGPLPAARRRSRRVRTADRAHGERTARRGHSRRCCGPRRVYGHRTARLRPAGDPQAQRNLSQRVRAHAVGRGPRGRCRRAGQRIATMGTGPQGDAMLYFEIRINGTPGNPLSFLPQRRRVIIDRLARRLPSRCDVRRRATDQ